MASSSPLTIVWFRQDLRLSDHPALAAAIAEGNVLPVYIASPEEEQPWAPGAASRWWLHHSLQALSHDLEKKGSRLILRRGPALSVLRGLIHETGATAVRWTRRYEPAVIARDKKLKETLAEEGVPVSSVNGSLLLEPWEMQTQTGKPFQVFTPFWKSALNRLDPPPPLPAPTKIPSPTRWPDSDSLASWKLLPTLPWAVGFEKEWQPGERGAQRRLALFVEGVMQGYGDSRNRPDEEGTSRLSPHLHWGEISPRQIWHACGHGPGAAGYLREIGWREFAFHLLYHFPHTPDTPLRPAFKKFPWKKDAATLRRWQKGQTGYPIVDAGMRELWATGWMHNRVRMVVASFLIKDLLIDWREGAAWFWDTLVDADLANNTLGWQWTAGCGADASPYYRVFNPALQAEKFDPKGDYIRRWVPEIGTDRYPPPMVDHAAAREQALILFKSLK